MPDDSSLTGMILDAVRGGHAWHSVAGLEDAYLGLRELGAAAVDVLPCRGSDEREFIWVYADDFTVFVMQHSGPFEPSAVEQAPNERDGSDSCCLRPRKSGKWVEVDVVDGFDKKFE